MEIVDYLRAARRRLWLIILLPVLSAMAAASVILVQPTMYMATATVDPPALVGGPTAQYTGAQGVTQFVAAFQATAGGPLVRNAVAAQNKVSTADLTDQLVVAQRGGSPSVTVTFTSKDKTKAVPVVQAVSALTLKAMFSTQVESAQARLDQATADVAKASDAVGAFTAEIKMADPQKAYEAQLNRVNALIQQQASMRAGGNAVAAAAMSAPIASANAALDRFGPILNKYNSLNEARTAAVANVNLAQNQLAQAAGQLDAANPAKIVYTAPARAVDQTDTLWRIVASVAAAAFVLALLLVLMLEVMTRGRTARPLGTAAVGDSVRTAEQSGSNRSAKAIDGPPASVPARARH